MGKAIMPQRVKDTELELQRLDALSNEELKAEFEHCRNDFADNLIRLACLVKVAHRRGLVLDGIPGDFKAVLLQIADRQLDAEAYRRFYGTVPGRYMNRLPLPEQERLAAGGKVKVYVFEGGKVDSRDVDPLLLNLDEARQVFGPQGMRNAAAQRSYLEGLSKRKRPVPLASRIVPNKRKHCVEVWIGEQKVEIGSKELATLLAQLQ